MIENQMFNVLIKYVCRIYMVFIVGYGPQFCIWATLELNWVPASTQTHMLLNPHLFAALKLQKVIIWGSDIQQAQKILVLIFDMWEVIYR
jgi:hypothetical protein